MKQSLTMLCLFDKIYLKVNCETREEIIAWQRKRHNARGAGRKLKLTAEQAEQVKKLSSEGLTYRKISEQVGISPATVMRYLKKM